MSNTTSWPGNPLDPTRCYRAVLDGLIYVLVPAKGQPGLWHAMVKRGHRRLKWTLQPVREDALAGLFERGFFPVGLQLVRDAKRRVSQ